MRGRALQYSAIVSWPYMYLQSIGKEYKHVWAAIAAEENNFICKLFIATYSASRDLPQMYVCHKATICFTTNAPSSLAVVMVARHEHRYCNISAGRSN